MSTHWLEESRPIDRLPTRTRSSDGLMDYTFDVPRACRGGLTQLGRLAPSSKDYPETVPSRSWLRRAPQDSSVAPTGSEIITPPEARGGLLTSGNCCSGSYKAAQKQDEEGTGWLPRSRAAGLFDPDLQIRHLGCGGFDVSTSWFIEPIACQTRQTHLPSALLRRGRLGPPFHPG